MTGSTLQAEPSHETKSTSQGPVALTFHYDAATGSYTVTGLNETQAFAPSDKTGNYAFGQIEYRKTLGSRTDYLRLLDLASPTNGARKYVGAGYWQRDVPNADGSAMTTRFDAFTYGLEIAAVMIPRSGAATFAVDLFARYAPLDLGPRILTGSGNFQVDFAAGSFGSSVWVYERNIYEDYWTGQHLWQAEGRLGAGNGFTGLFGYQGRYANVSGALSGRFYGPAGEELGAVFNGTDANGTLAVGTLVGSKGSNTLATPLSLLPQAFDQQFFMQNRTFGFSRYRDTQRVDSGLSEIPGLYGSITFAGGGEIMMRPDISSMSMPQPVFTAADRVGAESNATYTVYRQSGASETNKLTLFNPGAGNPQLALTYASFGRWDRIRELPERQETTNLWFTYGVRTVAMSLPRVGSARYNLNLHGSGITFANSALYVLSGGGGLKIDFAADTVDGSISPVATAIGKAPPIALPTLLFSGQLWNTYGFQVYMKTGAGPVDGEIVGGLYGPGGAEFAGHFVYFPRNENGFATGHFAGVAVGKKQ